MSEEIQTCACGESAVLIECEFCGGKFCPDCFEGAKKEVGGGLNVKGTGWNCCYGCAEKQEVQFEIAQEVCELTAAKCARTGNLKDLCAYFAAREKRSLIGATNSCKQSYANSR